MNSRAPLAVHLNPPGAPPPAGPGLNVGDVYYALFRHKYRIICLSLLGFAAAAGVYKLKPQPFESDAKLFIRYVISEGTTELGPPRGEATAKSPDQRGETLLNTEVEILRSRDLARQVAEAIGPERLLAKARGRKDLNQAIILIQRNLQVNVPPRSSVIRIAFTHEDPELVQPVLREIIDRYLKNHKETHQATGIMAELLIQETDQYRSKLHQIEEELRKVLQQAGIVSLETAKTFYDEQMAEIRNEIFRSRAQLVERMSIFSQLSGTPATIAARPAATAAPEAEIPSEKAEEYRATVQLIALLQREQQTLLATFKPENSRVRDIQTRLEKAEGTRRQLESDFPTLTRARTPAPEIAPPPVQTNERERFDPRVALAEIKALEAKIEELNKQLETLRAEFTNVDRLEGSIQELRRRKEFNEANYKYYSAGLERSRINETLGSGRVFNIVTIQTPSAPYTNMLPTFKLMGMVAMGGMGLGVAWAFLIELFLDRSIRRPIDVERKLKLPLFLTLPAVKTKRPSRKIARLPGHSDAGGNSRVVPEELLSATNATGLHPFFETLRDRMISYFESRNMTHKPKLIAVTGLGSGSGITTIAAGLSHTLSETAEGNVLLVDMTRGQGSAQRFVKGAAVCGLDELLEARDQAHVQERLYVVSEADKSEHLSRNLPQRFSKLVPKLKASEFDYIIFDMPPISQISITPRLAGFMDMVLLVAQSEKTDGVLLQRAASLLAESTSNLGVVLNRARTYVPARLHQEFADIT